jgi:hypothetical protein
LKANESAAYPAFYLLLVFYLFRARTAPLHDKRQLNIEVKAIAMLSVDIPDCPRAHPINVVGMAVRLH